MNRILYDLTQKIAAFGLFCYYREIQLHGVRGVPSDKPVMFLANHQNALMDPLVIAAYTSFRTYFLTRSDIFINPLVNRIFSFLRMLPVYRMRDGRDTLERNLVIFENCTQILEEGGRILIFPEANHNIMRRVRPLSKGFIRILFAALDKDDHLYVLLVPVGINYEDASGFPDRVAFYFGQPISSRELYTQTDLQGSIVRFREAVSSALKINTTHIDEELDHDEVQDYLSSLHIDYLDPRATNEAVGQFEKNLPRPGKKDPALLALLLRTFFLMVNAPVILIWRVLLKPRILEVEFVSTIRFAYVLVAQPIFYVLLWWACAHFSNASLATAVVMGHFLFNLLFVRWGQTRTR